MPIWSCGVHLFCTAGTLVTVLLFGKRLAEARIIEGTGTLIARVKYSMTAFQTYGLSLFGKAVEECGGGGIVDTSKAYFFLDISYIRILIKYGILFLLIYLVLMTLNSYHAAVSRDPVLVLILAVIAINCLGEHHALEYCYNIFLVTGMTSVIRSVDRNRQLDR